MLTAMPDSLVSHLYMDLPINEELKGIKILAWFPNQNSKVIIGSHLQSLLSNGTRLG